jgi:dCTP deaminase
MNTNLDSVTLSNQCSEEEMDSLFNSMDKTFNSNFETLMCWDELKLTGLMSDKEILKCSGMITPFVDHIVREVDGRKVLSYGLGSYGYDVRLSSAEFFIYKDFSNLSSDELTEIDPKNFDKNKCLVKQEIQVDKHGNMFFVMPPHSYGMAVVEECLDMPADVTAIGFCKSSYTRACINTHITPIEAGWRGHLTVAMSNMSPLPARIYAEEGLAQILFFRSSGCRTTYEDRKGKYQDQGKAVTTAKV